MSKRFQVVYYHYALYILHVLNKCQYTPIAISMPLVKKSIFIWKKWVLHIEWLLHALPIILIHQTKSIGLIIHVYNWPLNDLGTQNSFHILYILWSNTIIVQTDSEPSTLIMRLFCFKSHTIIEWRYYTNVGSLCQWQDSYFLVHCFHNSIEEQSQENNMSAIIHYPRYKRSQQFIPAFKVLSLCTSQVCGVKIFL